MTFDEPSAHQHFSASWFNQVWSYIDLPSRTPLQEEEMLELALASLAHWRSRTDVENRNLSIGCWLVSRVLALAGEAPLAMRYARRCQEYAAAEPAFYQGYAAEALARASHAAGESPRAKQYLAEAYALAARVPDPEERQQLEDDLDSLNSSLT